jgi:hypothetical protein
LRSLEHLSRAAGRLATVLGSLRDSLRPSYNCTYTGAKVVNVVFNREYQKRATRQGLASRGGGHKVAADAALRLPWAGIFEPWRPYILVAAAAEKQPKATKTAAKGCKKSRQLNLFDGKLRGVQLSLFPDMQTLPNPVQKPRQSSADSEFPALAGMIDPMAEVMTEEELAAEFEKL